MPATAVIDRDAFLPYFFNGLTTVRIRPDYLLHSTPNGLPISLAQLREGMHASGASATDLADRENPGGRIYWLDWPRHFDDVLVQRFGADPGPLPDNLSLLAHGTDMDLYRIKRD